MTHVWYADRYWGAKFSTYDFALRALEVQRRMFGPTGPPVQRLIQVNGQPRVVWQLTREDR